MSRAWSTVTPLCARAARVLVREPLAQRRVARIEDRRAVESSPSAGRRAAHAVVLAEQRQVDDPAAQQDLRRAQDALLGRPPAARCGAVGARAVEQLVLEHQRRDHRRPR